MLSSRASNFASVPFFHGPVSRYDPDTNPNGHINLAQAQNFLIQDKLIKYINSHNTFEPSCVTYNEGFTGTLRLRTAMASHINNYFNPARAVDAEDLTFQQGVTSLNEACAFMFCDYGKKEAIMLGRPIYGSFTADLALRTGIELEYVSFGETDQFDRECVEVYEKAIDDAKARGVNVKALLLCNPHNPLGRCYSREALVGLLRLCGKRKIHLISDEIYALSVYKSEEGRRQEEFTSVLSIDLEGLVSRDQVHVQYGLAKDFGAAGMRLGCLITWNTEFKKGTRAIGRFSYPSEFSQALASTILEDQSFVTSLIAESRQGLFSNRRIAESLLNEASIKYEKQGNGGIFLWIDLSPFLPLSETEGDPWKAELLLSKRFSEANLAMAYGKGFQSLEPGRFRLLFGAREQTLREAIRRIIKVISQ